MKMQNGKTSSPNHMNWLLEIIECLKWLILDLAHGLILLSYSHASSCTLVPEKKGTFICESILEYYIDLRNTQKLLKIKIMFETEVSWKFI